MKKKQLETAKEKNEPKQTQEQTKIPNENARKVN